MLGLEAHDPDAVDGTPRTGPVPFHNEVDGIYKLIRNRAGVISHAPARNGPVTNQDTERQKYLDGVYPPNPLGWGGRAPQAPPPRLVP